MDYYGGSVSLLFIAVFEIIAFSWIYGYSNLAKDIQFMLKRKLEKLRAALRPDEKWGPMDEVETKVWKRYDSTDLELPVQS
ncbi:sodium- and chloride-dependent glycine transporter 2-like protein [Leptotrombidium deliense]|uniref:Sodium-and chloride-dependent glycine transporter 2-like protein n=1 Tax=Leptotrombidium deliense TaxID=299467 RepID=A0A443RU04_9ACAR|nr:sodium- and chloride-dependent glycine transporter 2-like protein [Leptotrombidium deliense]